MKVLRKWCMATPAETAPQQPEPRPYLFQLRRLALHRSPWGMDRIPLHPWADRSRVHIRHPRPHAPTVAAASVGRAVGDQDHAGGWHGRTACQWIQCIRSRQGARCKLSLAALGATGLMHGARLEAQGCVFHSILTNLA